MSDTASQNNGPAGDQAQATDDQAQVTDAQAADQAQASQDPDGGDPAGSADLGDAGKKALDSMKSKWREERDQRRKLAEELEALKAPKAPASDDKADAAEIKRQATRDANAKANTRVVRSEIKAAAAGKLADPADALAHLDPKSFEVDENGDVDAEELADAIEDLLKRKPYLAASGRPRFQGTGDGGAVHKTTGPAQLTREDLRGMSPAAINKARTEGRLNVVLGIK